MEPCPEIKKRPKIIDTIEYKLKPKWKWAGHIARTKDSRWTKQSGNQGEGRDQGDDQAEDGKTTDQRRGKPPGTGKQ